MVEVVLLKGIEPVTGVKASAGSPGYATRLLSQLAPGQLLFARVEAILSDGSFKVVVAGQEMRMALPSYVAAGDMLELTFLTREPRPTFSLQENLPAMTSAPVLSAAGRLVAALMPQAGAPAMIAASPTAAPLLDTLPENGATLSAALEKTLTQSGLFYESHQADWVAGKRDLAQLQNI